VSDLKFPAGIKAVSHGTQNPVVVAVTEPKVEEEARPLTPPPPPLPPAAPGEGQGWQARRCPRQAAEPAKKK
jgi:large subunit ribosomal protein L25